MSKVGMTTFVKVCSTVRSPNSSSVNDLRYFPSYFGPVAPNTLVFVLVLKHRNIHQLQKCFDYEYHERYFVGI